MPKETIDCSLNWKDTPTEINTSTPTTDELRRAILSLRANLAVCLSPIPYTFTICRKEVAYKLSEIFKNNGYKSDFIAIKIPKKIEFCMHNNCYKRIFIIAKHPKAFEEAVNKFKNKVY